MSNEFPVAKRNNDALLAGQGASYERQRQLNARERAIGNPCDSSTPAKASAPQNREPLGRPEEPRQTIQELAQLVMKSARWRNGPENQRKDLNVHAGKFKTCVLCFSVIFTCS